ncbi:autophagy protein [Coemansia sp. RSA 552]|nr:autophagy protein [Coemansia sp. RSA 552]
MSNPASGSTRCQRCSRKLEFLGPEWKEMTAADTEALLATLPSERCEQLRTVLGAHELWADADTTELSGFFGESFRADTVERQADGGISVANEKKAARAMENMRGSLALVLDSSAQRQSSSSGYGDDSTIGTGTEDGRAGVHSAAGQNGQIPVGAAGSQGESFIILSSSQLHPLGGLGRGMSQLSVDSRGSEGRIRDLAQSVAKGAEAGGAQEGEGAEDDDIAETLSMIGRVADLMEERSVLGHPMCEDCAEIMLRVMDREIGDSERERQILEDVGRAAELKLSADAMSAADVAALEGEIRKQEAEEQALEETLKIMDEQLDQLCGRIGELDAEARELDACELQMSRRRNDLDFVLEQCEAEQWSLDEQYARLAAQLTQLQRTNVYNDVFNITVTEGIASINGFRLGGRSAPHSVEWSEINAAWGQALLLLQTVARRLGHEFVGYRLIPMGSFSRIERVPEHGADHSAVVSLELFGSGDLYLGRLFQTRRFDAAMVAFLACLDQVAQLIMSLNSQLSMPYRIDQDKVGSVSIRPQFGQDDVWTRACKNTLMDARWALAFASSYTP